MRGGLTGILLIGGVLYFSDAGSWIGQKLQGLNEGCYGALAPAGPSIANPVCNGIAVTFEKLENLGDGFDVTLQNWKEQIFGSRLGNSFTQGMNDQLTRFGSSKEQLDLLMRNGPSLTNSNSMSEQLQRAIDNFEIGQYYLKDSNVKEALPWLQQGASQSQGLGLMSQLALGDIYMRGGGGVPANPTVAKVYLEQAKASLSTLSTSNSFQSQQLLDALPQSPQATQAQIDQMLRSIK